MSHHSLVNIRALCTGYDLTVECFPSYLLFNSEVI